MKRKIEITVHQKRPIDRLFNRVADVFERKFDGMPAVVEGPSRASTTEVTSQVDADALARIIADNILDDQHTPPPCPDTTPESCYDDGDGGIATPDETWVPVYNDEFFRVDGIIGSTSLQGTLFSGDLLTTGSYTRSFDPGTLRKRQFVLRAEWPAGTTRVRYAGYFYGSWNAPDDGPSSNIAGQNIEYEIIRKIDDQWPLGGTNPTYNSPFSYSPTPSTGHDAPGQVVHYGVFNVPLAPAPETGAYTQGFAFTMQVPFGSTSGQFYIKILSGAPTGFFINTSTTSSSPSWPLYGNTPGLFYQLNQHNGSAVATNQSACSGSTVVTSLMWSVTESAFVPQLTASYFIDVWINGIPAVRGTDYTVCDGKLCGVSSTAEVTARYMVA